VKVCFVRGREQFEAELDAVPRFGEPVFADGDGEPPMLVWNVGWRLTPPCALVVLKTEQAFNREMYGRHDPAREPREGMEAEKHG
jgi:hypothetical protein